MAGARSPLRNTSTMQLSEKKLREYLVLVPDFPDALQKRREAQPAHIKAATPLIEAGQLPYFGVTLAKHAAGDGGGPLDINGSLMVMKMGSEGEVREALQTDAYARAGVWDVAKATILPFQGG